MTTDDADKRAAMNTAQDLEPTPAEPMPDRPGVPFGDTAVRRCHAHTSSGRPCGQPAKVGMAVCRIHGGSSPQAIEAARRRLLGAVDAVAEDLVSIATNPGEKTQDRLRAMDSLMDRAGLPRATQVEVGQTRKGLLDRLDALPAAASQSGGEGDADERDQLSAAADVGPDAPELEDSDTVAVSSPSQPVDESPGESPENAAGAASGDSPSGLHVEPSHGVQSESHHTESTERDHE